MMSMKIIGIKHKASLRGDYFMNSSGGNGQILVKRACTELVQARYYNIIALLSQNQT